MILYFIPLMGLSLLSIVEIREREKRVIHSKTFYFFLGSLFIIFLGFKSQIGCDWLVYKKQFYVISQLSFSEVIQNTDRVLHSILTKLISLKFDHYVLESIYGIFFTLSLLLFATITKYRYLALVVAYPYFMLVVGMGPIVQSVSIAFFMLSIVSIEKFVCLL